VHRQGSPSLGETHLYAASQAGLIRGNGVTVPLTPKSCHSLNRPGKLLK